MKFTLAWAGARLVVRTESLRCSYVQRNTLARTFAHTAPHRSQQRSRGKALKQLLPNRPARTRFAPSPTGHLHLGSLRTALFNYLLAKKTGGQFILRIEDTDKKRTVADAQTRLCHDLRWAGLQWDEGPDVGGPHAPYNQSQRTELYQKHANDLIQKGVAYRCFCPADSLAVDASDPSALATRIGGCQNDCSHLNDAQVQERLAKRSSHVVRFAFDEISPAWTDLVYGPMKTRSVEGRSETSSIADTILLKSDGTPTYHLANVVDDHAMEITHVIRGTEWMSSTPLHVALYAGFGWEPPAFAHVGLLTDEEGNKLSKRNFDTNVKSLTEKYGLLPEALNNFLALMGWSNPEKSDVRDLDELVTLFDLKFTKGNSTVSLDKLWYLQRHHARRRAEGVKQNGDSRSLDTIVQYLLKDNRTSGVEQDIATILGTRTLAQYLECIVLADAGNYESSDSFLTKNRFYLQSYDGAADSFQQITSSPLQGSIDQIIKAFFGDAATVLDLSLWDKPFSLPLHDILSEASLRLNERLTRLCVAEAETITGVLQGNVKKTPEYKLLSKQLHDKLRQRLTFSCEPGPASIMIMIVLGHMESRRRILG